MLHSILGDPDESQIVETRPFPVPCRQSVHCRDVRNVGDPEPGGVFFVFGVDALSQRVFSGACRTAGASFALDSGEFIGVAAEVAIRSRCQVRSVAFAQLGRVMFTSLQSPACFLCRTVLQFLGRPFDKTLSSGLQRPSCYVGTMIKGEWQLTVRLVSFCSCCCEFLQFLGPGARPSQPFGIPAVLMKTGRGCALFSGDLFLNLGEVLWHSCSLRTSKKKVNERELG